MVYTGRNQEVTLSPELIKKSYDHNQQKNGTPDK